MSVKQFVEESIEGNKIVVFSKSYCPYCKRAKALLKDNYPSEEFLVYELDERDDGSDIQAYLAEKTGQRTVPNIFVGQNHVGGCDAVTAAHKSGQLSKLISA
ncbi:glutaredoxin [Cylindrobasidium torrendii FP15055 ss-10]|uniref:glutathione peroxidase n=1 Tax=Cylindrobasidium torrendii FP15055 ss-10 TaxID=1314674 RepID=A0A0D7BH13_9AGAR|nr:glutaredoxin [Cylindrobasidium torrendii FP15055 ss-10]